MRPCPILSVVVPGYNNSDLSFQVITDILRTADYGKHEFELIFVDDGSSDDTPQRVTSFGNEVRYIRHEENRGVSPAWNTGIKAATGDFVAILNNDVRISDEHWMTKLVGAIQGRKAIAGPELVNFNAASEYNGQNVPYLNGWCYIFPRRIFAEIGLFEEAFAPASFEDVEFCSRAVAHGYDLVQVDLRMQHSYSKTVLKYLRDRMASLNERNRRIWLERMAATDLPRMRIVFDCPGNMRGGWTPTSLEDRGIGGAETAITLLVRELASRGHEVLLFNDIPNSITVNRNISYHPRSLLPGFLDCDAFVTFRCPSEYISQTTAKTRIFWSCDQQTSGDWRKEIFPHVDKVVTISDYHQQYMIDRWHSNPDDTVVIGCPIAHWNYEPHADKDPNQFIFCSVPGRGLEYMATVMRNIRKQLPDAKLTITSDYRLWGVPEPRNDEYRVQFRNEEFLGMVSKADLIRLQNLSMAYPYPCTYEECFCIAVAECAAAGAIPISTNIGAVAQTIGESGYIVGPPTDDFAHRVADQTLSVYGKPDLMRKAIEESWRWSAVTIGSLWENLLYGDTVPQHRSPSVPTTYSYKTESGDITSNKTTPV